MSQDESELVSVFKELKKVGKKKDMQIQFNRIHVITEDYTRSGENDFMPTGDKHRLLW